MLPTKPFTDESLWSTLRATRKHLGLEQELELRQNMARRSAVFVVNGPQLTPGYLTDAELYCWFCGVWLRHDKKELFDER